MGIFKVIWRTLTKEYSTDEKENKGLLVVAVADNIVRQGQTSPWDSQKHQDGRGCQFKCQWDQDAPQLFFNVNITYLNVRKKSHIIYIKELCKLQSSMQT